MHRHFTVLERSGLRVWDQHIGAFQESCDDRLALGAQNWLSIGSSIWSPTQNSKFLRL
jgi:hypothetical protein